MSADEPVAIQFSGGRSSAYMLRHILDAHNGALPSNCRVLFQNTGKERPKTLDFIQECSIRWNVEITCWSVYTIRRLYLFMCTARSRVPAMRLMR